jgi:predicted AlkP superfamily pyrophosphatase or phosphodiesterase
VLSTVIATACALLALFWQPAPVARIPPPPHRIVILVTIDGLRGDYLGSRDRYHLKLPTLRRLMREGAVSERTISVYPTLTGTAHTSLVTGTGAGKHGILGNNKFDPSVWTWDRDNYDRQPPYRHYAEIAVGTLWSAARAKGLKTAALGWPQTMGAPIDYSLEILVGPSAAESNARIHRTASPGTWLAEIEQRLGPLAALDLRMADHVKALVGAELLRRFSPAFMAVHFSLTDTTQHAYGPGSPEALAALEVTDQNLGTLLAGLTRDGVGPETTIVVTGDHGFLPMHTQLAINLPLVEAGLIRRAPDGRPAWRAIVAPHRGLGSVYVEDADDREAATEARRALEAYARRYPGRFRIVERAELDQLRADRAAVFGVEPSPGYVLDARLAPPFAVAHDRAAGHGYHPETPGMETALVIAGAGVRPGVRLPVTATIDVAPTIARLLGLDLPDADGQPIVGALREDR